MSARGLYTADPRERVDQASAAARIAEMHARASTLSPAQKRVLVRLAAGDTIREAGTNCELTLMVTRKRRRLEDAVDAREV